MSDYPQHDKLTSLDGLNQNIGDFIEWLKENGMWICEFSEQYQEYITVQCSTESLIARYFGIDEKEFSLEKDRMLEEFRKLMEEKQQIEKELKE